MDNKELLKLLNIEKSLIYFTTSLRSNEFMMEKIQKPAILNILNMLPQDKDTLTDILIDTRQALETASIYSRVLRGVRDAFASIINNNLNMVMKFLTSVTIILMLPTLIASIYGMNIRLPFQYSPHAFAITMGISFGLTVLAIVLFWKRRWF